MPQGNGTHRSFAHAQDGRRRDAVILSEAKDLCAASGGCVWQIHPLFAVGLFI